MIFLFSNSTVYIDQYNSLPNLILTVAIIGGSSLYVLWRKYSFKQSPSSQAVESDTSASSAIMAYYSAGHKLVNMDRGKVADMRYSLYATEPEEDGLAEGNQFVKEEAAIFVLDLPFNTQAHILGLSKERQLNRLQFESFLKSSGLEKVELEGDFPDYFDIYAAKGQDVQVRYILNPKAMGYVVDYCRSHFWEISDAEMYFVATSADSQGSSIVEESQKFVTQIQPALLPGDPSAPVVHHDVPYGEYDGPALPCPICNQTMTMNDEWQTCPKGEGILINARNLVRLHDNELQIPSMPNKDTPHQQLTCPNCHNQMENVFYDEGNVKIESCEHCPFRWLDADKIPLLISKDT